MAGENRFAFTKTKVAALPVPETGRSVYHDVTPGLILRITAKGRRSFCYYKKVRGRPVRMLLGTFPEMSVEGARVACRVASGAVAQGRDLMAERQTARHEQTVGGLWQFWLTTHAQKHKRTWAEDERQYNKFLKPWANRKLSSIRKADVATLHAKVGTNNGRYAANRVLSLVRAMFNKAADMGFAGTNPTAGIKKYPEEKRDRFLHGDDLKAFFVSLAVEPNTSLRDFFAVALLTGARRSNVQTMMWRDIDFATGLWRIPETKSGHPVVVPLVGPVLQVLRARRDSGNGSEWVFPGRGKTGHLTEPKTAWKRVCKRAGLSDVRPHDLRRSLASWMAITGSSLPVVGKMLGHTQPSTTAIYARLSTDPVRLAAETATAAMLAAAGNPLLTIDVDENGGGHENHQ